MTPLKEKREAVERSPTIRVEVLAYPIDRVTMDEAVEHCRSFIEGDRRPRLIVTVNAAILAMAERCQRLRSVVRGGHLVLADGVSVVWAARLLGVDLRHRVAGVDLMERLAQLAHDEHFRLFFLGARPEVVRKVVARIESEYPGVVVAGYRDGYFPSTESAEVIEQVRESRADILFVAMQSPFKELWCFEHLDDLGVPVVLPVGGAFDVFSGAIRRAPLWMQDVGLEWTWRLMMEPRKMWRRYLFLNSSFVWLCVRAIFQKHR